MRFPSDFLTLSKYQTWRDAKLAAVPERVGDLVVEIKDPEHPSPAERQALLERLGKTNMAVFAAPPASCSKETMRRFCASFGLARLDANQLADDDGISPLAVAPEGTRTRYIPYTDRPIAWHTDGYYNDMAHQVRGLVLWCQSPAQEGGANALLDHELAFIALCDRDPGLAQALMRHDAFAIPANEDAEMNSRDMHQARALKQLGRADSRLQSEPVSGSYFRRSALGPVFSVFPDGHLHMRYTARTRSIEWNEAGEVQEAKAALEEILAHPPFGLFEHRLEAGQGLLSNNILHTRQTFKDDPKAPRLLWRARFYDRISES